MYTLISCAKIQYSSSKILDRNETFSFRAFRQDGSCGLFLGMHLRSTFTYARDVYSLPSDSTTTMASLKKREYSAFYFFPRPHPSRLLGVVPKDQEICYPIYRDTWNFGYDNISL